MLGINKIILMGNLGRDPELRAGPTGVAVAKLSLATTQKVRGSEGEPEDRVEWHRLVAFGKEAELLSQYLHKGDPLFVEGELRTKKWTDSEERTRYSTEVLVRSFRFLPVRRSDGDSQHMAAAR